MAHIEVFKVIRKVLKPLVLSAVAMVPQISHAIDVDAGDYEAAPPGTNVGLIYYQHVSRNATYDSGRKIPNSGRLNSDIGILRVVHFTEIWGMTADPQFLLPFGSLRGGGDMKNTLGRANGIGDPVLLSTFWVQNDSKNGVWTGVSPYVYVPVGEYDHNEVLNLGENRWRYALQVAHVRRLNQYFSVDLVGDVTFYGRNNEYGSASQELKQDPLYQAQAWFRYHLTPSLDLRFLASRTIGGETSVDGKSQHDRIGTNKIAVGAGYFIDEGTQVLAMFGQDVEVQNGFRESSRVNIRVLKTF